MNEPTHERPTEAHAAAASRGESEDSTAYPAGRGNGIRRGDGIRQSLSAFR